MLVVAKWFYPLEISVKLFNNGNSENNQEDYIIINGF